MGKQKKCIQYLVAVLTVGLVMSMTPVFSFGADQTEPMKLFTIETSPIGFEYLQIREAKGVKPLGNGQYEETGETVEYYSVPKGTVFTVKPIEGSGIVDVMVSLVADVREGDSFLLGYHYESEVLTDGSKWVNRRNLKDGTKTNFRNEAVSFTLPLKVEGTTYDSYDDLIYRLDISGALSNGNDSDNNGTKTRDRRRIYVRVDEEVPVAGNYLDVKKYHYYYEPVKWAVESGMLGPDAQVLKPEEDAPRGEVITYIWKQAGSPEPSVKNPFMDVKETDPCYKAVLWAYENKYTTGTTETTFDPQMTCTRAQVVTFLWRVANEPYPYEGWESMGITNPFTDVSVSDYFYTPVLWAMDTGITTGTSPTTFSPDMNCRRAQILTFLWRGLKE